MRHNPRPRKRRLPKEKDGVALSRGEREEPKERREY
jgi:hypothetical protein